MQAASDPPGQSPDGEGGGTGTGLGEGLVKLPLFTSGSAVRSPRLDFNQHSPTAVTWVYPTHSAASLHKLQHASASDVFLAEASKLIPLLFWPTLTEHCPAGVGAGGLGGVGGDGGPCGGPGRFR